MQHNTINVGAVTIRYSFVTQHASALPRHPQAYSVYITSEKPLITYDLTN